MTRLLGNKTALTATIFALLLAGCASAPKTTVVHPLTPSTNLAAISGIRAWLASTSRLARSMNVSGDITVDENGESNSASFGMKSKRIDPNCARIDSLSVEVMGPFGIKVARFLASPEKYEFYDILHGQTLAGATDTHSLEDLTHLNGISLQDMSDIIYGLVWVDSNAEDSMEFYSDNAHHFALLIREPGVATSALDFEGTVPNDTVPGKLSLVRYRRWQGTPPTLDVPPAIVIQFSEPALIDGMSIPQHIEAMAGGNRLTLEYNHIELNPASLVVRIKMP